MQNNYVGLLLLVVVAFAILIPLSLVIERVPDGCWYGLVVVITLASIATLRTRRSR